MALAVTVIVAVLALGTILVAWALSRMVGERSPEPGTGRPVTALPRVEGAQGQAVVLDRDRVRDGVAALVYRPDGCVYEVGIEMGARVYVGGGSETVPTAWVRMTGNPGLDDYVTGVVGNWLVGESLSRGGGR